MFTNYGPYDLYQIEHIKQDKKRELQAFFTPPAFEGVSVKVQEGRCHGSPFWALLIGLFHKTSPTTTPIRHQASHLGRV